MARNVEQLTQRLTIGLPILVGLGRLEASAGEQRRFVSDASHELRSPVAVIRAGLELARSKNDHANWMTLVDSLLAEEFRLETLLDDLLLLAANDENGTTTAPSEAVNLTALTLTEARRPRRVPVDLVDTLADDQTVLVAGVPDQLACALSNLADNAARHATSVVQISLTLDDDMARLVIDDDGPGIAQGDRERVFERFTRLDDGRARRDGGTGLGLAVVRSVFTYHHGHVRVEDGPLGGARLVAELPLAGIDESCDEVRKVPLEEAPVPNRRRFASIYGAKRRRFVVQPSGFTIPRSRRSVRR